MKKKFKLLKGNNLDLLKTLPDNSIDSICTDPPYGLTSIVKRFGKEGSALCKDNKGEGGPYQRASKGFMGKEWDGSGIEYNVEFWKECYRVLKPGGHLLSFGGSRTYHRMACAIEDAGFDIRDQIMWVYGSGFPKSLNIGKAIDKKIIKSSSEYEGYGTALKPSHEPICLARKPLSEKTIADNVLKWGTGGINIDGCRIESNEELGRNNKKAPFNSDGNFGWNSNNIKPINTTGLVEGRFPANFIHNGIEETWARFFYCPKVSSKERNMGCDELEENQSELNSGGIGRKSSVEKRLEKGNGLNRICEFCGVKQLKSIDCKCDIKSWILPYQSNNAPTSKNIHPTVKPIKLMAYLCRLITPPNGIVLDPFMGSGSTGIAALQEGFRFVGMEMDEKYFEIATNRISNVNKN
jgi:site-specific DNA-methyltransferase (adenine-specific)